MDYERKENRIRDLKKGSEKGYCRICNQYSSLSLDHIPPRSCGNGDRVSVNIDNKKEIFQNGFSCKTICEKCNNELLGAKYDKEFKVLYDRAIQHNKSKLSLPENVLPINIDCRSLFRGIFGHFLAITALNGTESIGEILDKPVSDMVKHFSSLRDFVLCKRNNLDDLDIYYWYYPKDDIFVSTFISVCPNIFNSEKIIFRGEVIKYYPLALFVVGKQEEKLPLPTVNFDEHLLNLNMGVHHGFPEHPLMFGVVINGNNSNVAVVKKSDSTHE